MPVDVTDAILVIASPILLWFLRAALRALTQWIGLQLEASDRIALEKLLRRGLALGVQKLGGPDGRVQVHLRNQLAAEVLQYAVKTSPDLVNRLTAQSDAPMQTRIDAEIADAKVLEARAP